MVMRLHSQGCLLTMMFEALQVQYSPGLPDLWNSVSIGSRPSQRLEH